MGFDETAGRPRRDGREEPAFTAEEIHELFTRALAEFGIEADSASQPASQPVSAPEPIPPEITTDAISEMLGRAGWTAPTPEDASATPAPRESPPTEGAETSPVPRESQCPSCYGSGTELCMSCMGSGYHTTEYTTTDWEGDVEYVTDQYPCGCSGGQVPCSGCGGRGTASQ